MAPRTAVVDVSESYEESIQRWAKDLGTAKIRRKIFNAIYGYVSKPRSRKQLMWAAGIKPGDAQQAQNEVEYLYGKHLIGRVDNDGSVEDGCRYLYVKDEHVRPHKDRIIKYADNKKLANRIATKRSPVLHGSSITKIVLTRQALKKRKPLSVLYLTANPSKRYALRVEVEVRQVQEAVRGSRLRDNITLHYSPAADLDSIINGLNDHHPGIVHFSGHGDASGVLVDHHQVKRPRSKVITFELLAKAMAATDTPPSVIVLNACRSIGARKAFLPPAKAIIVMQDSVSDLAATAFANKFYAAIASGQSLQSAFRQGRLAVEAVSLVEANTPQLVCAAGVNPKKIVPA
jgi:CHAT domain